jgi:hypothetical protein
MQLKRGCGCLTLILGLINAIVVMVVIIQAFQKTGTLLASLVLAAVFASNVAVCFMAGLSSVRRARTGTLPEGGEAEGETEGETEGDGESEGEDQ